MHSPNYEKVKKYYDDGYWSIDRVRKAVDKKWITPAEFTEITNRLY